MFRQSGVAWVAAVAFPAVYADPVSVVEYIAPTSAVSYGVPAQVVENVAPVTLPYVELVRLFLRRRIPWRLTIGRSF